MLLNMLKRRTLKTAQHRDASEHALECSDDENRVVFVQLAYLTWHLMSEVGELTTILAKMVWHGKTLSPGDARIVKIQHEIGDVLYFLIEIARVLEIDLDATVEELFLRLSVRQQQGKLEGYGDDR